MTVVSEIIRQAMRESNITALAQPVTTAELAEALPRLQSILSSTYGFEVGEQFTDWPIGIEGVTIPEGAAWTQPVWEWPRINVRLVAASASAQIVNLPVKPYDGSRIGIVDPMSRLAAAPITLLGNGRAIEGAGQVVLNTDGLMKIWMYRADTGNWTPVTPLGLDDPMPFPEEFDDYFITMLAMRLNPRYGRSMAAESKAILDRSLSQLRARYRQSENVGVADALLFTSQQYDSQGYRAYGNGVSIGDRGWM